MSFRGLALISVILPTHNRRDLLPRAIKSVLAQTYPQWELVVWDDGSTDDTAKFVQSLGDKRVKYFFSANHGVAYARNRAIEVSTGPLLAFLDSDDEWLDHKLADQVQAMSAYPDIDLLFGDFLNVHSTSGEKRRTFEQYAQVMKPLATVRLQNGLFLVQSGMLEILARDNFIATDTVMLRRDVLEKAGCFNEELRNGEDFELWWRLGLLGICFAYVTDTLLTRYKLPENLSGASIPACKSTLRALDICTQQCISQDRNDLVSFLNVSYRNAWQNLMPLYARAGNRVGMLRAFWQSLRYGFQLGTIRLLAQSVLILLGNATTANKA